MIISRCTGSLYHLLLSALLQHLNLLCGPVWEALPHCRHLHLSAKTALPFEHWSCFKNSLFLYCGVVTCRSCLICYQPWICNVGVTWAQESGHLWPSVTYLFTTQSKISSQSIKQSDEIAHNLTIFYNAKHNILQRLTFSVEPEFHFSAQASSEVTALSPATTIAQYTESYSAYS